MARGVFVAGTDTGVGKTTIATGLVRVLAEKRTLAVMKPCETGSGDDAARLVAACARPLDLRLVNPYRFSLPAAPQIAARREGMEIEIKRIAQAYESLSQGADLTVVEGAGGLLVPLGDETTNADLVVRLGLPMVLVARTQLGTINHTLLTAEVARHRGLGVLGVVFSQTNARSGPEEGETVATIVSHGKLRSFGILPWLSESVRSDLNLVAQQIRKHLDVDALVDGIFSF